MQDGEWNYNGECKAFLDWQQHSAFLKAKYEIHVYEMYGIAKPLQLLYD